MGVKKFVTREARQASRKYSEIRQQSQQLFSNHVILSRIIVHIPPLLRILPEKGRQGQNVNWITCTIKPLGKSFFTTLPCDFRQRV